MKVDWLIVGAGLTGSTFARVMAERGRKVLVIDVRQHIGGNAYDEYDTSGVLIHKYGPHLFHTNDARTWSFLSRFADWRPYMHRVLALVEGKWVPVPFNLTSIERLFPGALASEVTDKLVRAFGFGAKVPILKLKESNDPQIQFVARYVYEHVFVRYTRKQWGIEPEELDPAVTARVPVLLSRDDRYFQDTYQAMPAAGFTPLFQRMLGHKNIKVLLNAHHSEVLGEVAAERVLFTGRIDEFFGNRFGALPYRSIDFQFQTLNVERYQEAATHNYPNNNSFTRITEMKHISSQKIPGVTTLCTEFPMDYAAGANEPYYPIPQPKNRALYEQYACLREREAPNVIFAGRLGEYQYINMDQAVARALALAGER
jgi:UDP-galactopyranose mutase